MLREKNLQKDKKFKKSILKDMPEMIDIVYCLRFHMEGMWKLFNYLVQSHFQIADMARDAISKAIRRFEKSGGSKIALYAIAREPNKDITTEKVPISVDWDDARRSSFKRIGNLNNLHKRYITGKIQPPIQDKP